MNIFNPKIMKFPILVETLIFCFVFKLLYNSRLFKYCYSQVVFFSHLAKNDQKFGCNGV